MGGKSSTGWHPYTGIGIYICMATYLNGKNKEKRVWVGGGCECTLAPIPRLFLHQFSCALAVWCTHFLYHVLVIKLFVCIPTLGWARQPAMKIRRGSNLLG